MARSISKRTVVIIIAGVFVVATVSLFVVSALLPRTTSAPKPDYQTTSITLGGQRFSARVPMTEATQEKGLSGTKSLTESEAMLFVFDKDQRWGIWMKDMKIPIDIVWLDADKHIVFVKKNAQPDSYPEVFEPPIDARYVIEIAAGRSDDLGIQLGDRAQFTQPVKGKS